MSCYKEKDDPLVMGNYRGLKHLDHVMKFIERVIESIIRYLLNNIKEMQHGFMPGSGTMDSIFSVTNAGQTSQKT